MGPAVYLGITLWMALLLHSCAVAGSIDKNTEAIKEQTKAIKEQKR
jgi:hypothetical protein